MKTWSMGELSRVLRNLVPALNPSRVSFLSEQSCAVKVFETELEGLN